MIEKTVTLKCPWPDEKVISEQSGEAGTCVLGKQGTVETGKRVLL